MGYRFTGVFIVPCTSSAAEAGLLLGGYAKEISVPFRGMVVSFADELTKDEIKQRVLPASQQMKNSKVVGIDYSTWAGPVEYCYGFACQNGELIAGSEREEEDEAGDEVLINLLRILGVQSPSRVFLPFARGYFPNT